MAIIMSNEFFYFKNGKNVELKCDNALSSFELKSVFINGKEKYRFKGICKGYCFFNKKDELDGVVIKIKDNLNNIYFIGISEEKEFIRNSSAKCFEIIPTLEKDKNERVYLLES